jgi:hypothetical protein
VTAIRDRRSDPDADEYAVPWDELPIAGTKRGLPWWAAVLLGFGLAILGAFVDLKLQDHLTLLFKGCYWAGAITAVCAVQRRSLFGPMIQPPLVLAVTVPGIVLFASGLPANSDTLSTLLAVGRPLIDGFPTMAITTSTTVLLGFVRMYRERDPDPPMKVKSNRGKPASKRPGAARPASGDTAAGRGRPRPAPGQAPQRRNRPAADDGARRARGRDEGGEREPGTRNARQSPEPGARGPRQPRAPRADDTPGTSRPRRAPRADDPRGADGPRPTPRLRGNTPPPRSRPWDED